MSNSDFVTAFAPASIGNLAVGFDMLGLSIAGAGDRVSARKTKGQGVVIKEVRGMDGEIHPYLSGNSDENTASLAARSLWDAAGDGAGIELIVYKGVPLQSGMGSSAASAVAAAFAVNALLDESLPVEELLVHALAGEKFASGGLHADNVAPSLIGGLVLCPQVLLPQMISLPVPDGVSSVLLHPELQVNTAESRNRLAKGYTTDLWLAQQGYLAGFIAACAQNNVALMAECLKDVIIEPQRAESVPCFRAVQEAALKSGALGCSLSGSGPSIFALCLDNDAANLAVVMEQASRKMGYQCQSWISPLNAPGARMVD
ncbi:MAG: homoserine kinase [Proteobacteria bacterium]|nr:homoserine kinase [Pseudomonadota bacterium]MDA0993476.1 homoserine kinase [Pseudomonadota bacterium]